jgi:hypothetical protein
MKKRTLVPMFALVCCAVAGGALVYERKAPPMHVLTPSVAKPTFVSADSSSTGRELVPGRERTYAIDLDEDIVLGAPNGARDGHARAAKLTIGVRGSLGMTFVARDEAKLRVRCTFHATDLALKPAHAPVASLQSELATPFYAVLERDGRLVSLHVARSTSTFTRGLLRTIAASVQVTSSDAARWTTQELDATGRYIASYEKKANGTILKTRERYTEVGGEKSLEPVESFGKIEPKGSAEITLGAHGWPERIVAREDTRIDGGDSLPRITSTVHFTATLEATRQDVGGLGAFEREADELVEIPIAGGAPDPAADRRADAKLVAGASFDAIVSEVERATSAANALAVAQKLEAKLRLDPSGADAVAARAMSAPLAQGQVLVNALAGSGTTEGVRATGKLLLDRRASTELRVQAASALGLSSGARTDAAHALAKGLDDKNDDVRRASTLGLGAALQGLRVDDPEEAAGVVGELVRRYRAAVNDEEREIALRALGNTGDGSILPIAREVLASGSMSLRIAAVHALRFVAAKEADLLVAYTLEHGEDAGLRAAAVDTIGHRDFADHDGVLARALVRDGSESVRVEIVRLALRTGTKTPQLLVAVRGVAERDPSDEVRRVAAAVAAHG